MRDIKSLIEQDHGTIEGAGEGIIKVGGISGGEDWIGGGSSNIGEGRRRGGETNIEQDEGF